MFAGQQMSFPSVNFGFYVGFFDVSIFIYISPVSLLLFWSQWFAFCHGRDLFASCELSFRLIFAEQVLALSLDVGRQKPCLHFRHTELSTSIDIN